MKKISIGAKVRVWEPIINGDPMSRYLREDIGEVVEIISWTEDQWPSPLTVKVQYPYPEDLYTYPYNLVDAVVYDLEVID